jgi:hypothetical protein
MMDPAAMHFVIADSAMHCRALRHNTEDDMTVLMHSTHGISSLNCRIADSAQKITDEILCGVLGVGRCSNDRHFRLIETKYLL